MNILQDDEKKKEDFLKSLETELKSISIGDVTRNSFHIFDTRFLKEWCDVVKQELDCFAKEDGVEAHYNDTEVRVWNMAEISAYSKLFEEAGNMVCECLGLNRSVKTTLGIRNRPVSRSSDFSGRWHADSFFRQIKVFCFLSDVRDRNGGLQMLQHTNRIGFKVVNGILFLQYFNFREVFGQRFRRYRQLRESFVGKLLNDDKFELKTFCVKKGTIVVCDTSAIHRASVCEEDERYALTAYI